MVKRTSFIMPAVVIAVLGFGTLTLSYSHATDTGDATCHDQCQRNNLLNCGGVITEEESLSPCAQKRKKCYQRCVSSKIKQKKA